ncbi:MAG: AI-2E family transporter [Pseudomonadales bacterium]|nr:AI-2E family transporter [Pseudomonadales bacterium]
MSAADQDQQRYLNRATDVAIRIGALVLLFAGCFVIVAPFLLSIAWGCILAVALHGPFVLLSNRLGERRELAASIIVITLLALLIMPGVLLGGSLADDLQRLLGAFQAGTLQVPPPSEKVSSWPVVGTRFHAFWLLASQNLEEALAQIGPQMKPVAGWLLGSAAHFGMAMLQFVFAVLISGVLLVRSTAGNATARALSVRLAGNRGLMLVELAGATVRGVTRGILGVALIQSLLAGVALFAAGVPAAGVWTAAALVLAVIQVGVGLIMIPAALWVFANADTLPAVVFLVWTVLLLSLDNVLKPLLMGRGLDIPIAVIFIGAIGGFISQGIIGLFVGAVVLVLGFELWRAWIVDGVIQEPSA